MNSISDTSSQGLQGRGDYSNAYNARFSGQSSKLSVNSYESLDAGLTIKTREGDIVTLSTSRFSEMNANEYNSQGRIDTGNGSMSASRQTRELTLTTGELFSFSVQGDLNEQELADIESIIKGVDGIIGEMAEGDMDDAVAKAMAMGSYDSVSMYEADITVQRSYAVRSETRYAEAGRLTRAPQAPGLDYQKPATHVSSFVDQVAQLLEAQKEEALAQAQQPLSQLFAHYLKNKDTDEEAQEPKYKALEAASKDINQLINDMVKDIFKDTLDQII